MRGRLAMSVGILLTLFPAVVLTKASTEEERPEQPRRRATQTSRGLRIENGWFVHNSRVVWGYAQYNGWWRPGQRPNITRNAPGEVRPNRTEDLDKLTDNMLRYGYPGFEHNFGLWYDRRRDTHDTARRTDANVLSPFLEQPWARSDTGKAWDGLTKYDLTRYNPWYFNRLKEFAGLCDRKGAILFHNFYMQHALLETDAHYVDFPWRPVNCIQKTGMPDHNPAANVFYDITNPTRRRLHRAYIRKCLDELGAKTNVVFSVSEEYTGPPAFILFWLDTVLEWERDKGKEVLVAASGCKDVLDSILTDAVRGPRISTMTCATGGTCPMAAFTRRRVEGKSPAAMPPAVTQNALRLSRFTARSKNTACDTRTGPSFT